MNLCGYIDTDWSRVEKRLKEWDADRKYTSWQLIDEKGLGTMRLHDLLKQVSAILDPEDDVLNYFLHTFDDNGGFLRTRHCWWEEEVRNKEIPELSKVLVCFEEKFDGDGAFYIVEFEDIVEDETILDRMSPFHRTLVKCELFYGSDQDDWIECNIENSRQNGFGFAYLVDLKNRTYTVTGKSYQEYLADGTVM